MQPDVAWLQGRNEKREVIKMRVFERFSGTEVNVESAFVKSAKNSSDKENKTKAAIIKLFYSPYYAQYLAYSPIMNALVEEYKDAELVPYTPTKYELECIAKDPSYAENIPQYYIPGFDRRASSEAMDGRLKNEFWEGWKNGSDFVVRFVNRTNPNYRVSK